MWQPNQSTLLYGTRAGTEFIIKSGEIDDHPEMQHIFEVNCSTFFRSRSNVSFINCEKLGEISILGCRYTRPALPLFTPSTSVLQHIIPGSTCRLKKKRENFYSKQSGRKQAKPQQRNSTNRTVVVMWGMQRRRRRREGPAKKQKVSNFKVSQQL